MEGRLAWIGLTFRPDPSRPLAPETEVMQRLHPPADFSALVNARIYPAMTMIVSDLAAEPDRRSSSDFVIVTGQVLDEPPPPPRPGAFLAGERRTS